MRLLKRIANNDKLKITILLSLILILLIGSCVIVVNSRDKESPVISCDTEVIHLTKKEVKKIEQRDYKPLLKGMKASDNKDGDLTNRIIVYDVKMAMLDYYGIVSYRTVDRAGNVAEAKRIAYFKTKDEVLEFAARAIYDMYMNETKK